jgi:hypothetical protein
MVRPIGASAHRARGGPPWVHLGCDLTKLISLLDEAGLKRRCAMITLDQTTRFGHVGIHHQPNLRPVLREIPGRLGPSPAPVDLIPA